MADAPASARALRGLVLFAAIWTWLLVVLGAVVRVTESGLGCPDWPLCHGQLLPPLEPAALVEYSHRLATAVVTVVVGAIAVLAPAAARRDRAVIGLAFAAAAILAAQIVLGAVTVWLELPETVVTAHLAAAELLLGVLAVLAVLVIRPAAALGRPRVLYVAAALAAFLLILSGAHVRGSGSALACLAWPDCDGLRDALLPIDPLPFREIHMAHRYAALLVGGLVAWACLAAWREGHRVLAILGGTVFAAQVLVGAAYVWTQGSPVAQAAHLGGASLVWALLVGLAASSAVASAARAERATLGDYVALAKPAIIGLLLITALGGMFLAAAGVPPVELTLAVLGGGALGAAGANALNHVFDRDIDEVMARTRRRPIPAHHVTPEDALAFGLGLTVASFVVLAFFANLLAALITMAASVFYVLVYTLWLKRTTIQNIVIGGAAGAVPPLVGWAAVRGDLALPAFYLFAIVFFWTPAHFWALALLIREDYERAGVPMLPVVYGERAAAWGILLYTAALVALTLLLFTTRLVGLLYLATALVLGGVFLALAVQYLRAARRALARRLYLYSLVYLAVLFVSMMLDTVVTRRGVGS